jgi:hypothetical protein
VETIRRLVRLIDRFMDLTPELDPPFVDCLSRFVVLSCVKACRVLFTDSGAVDPSVTAAPLSGDAVNAWIPLGDN